MRLLSYIFIGILSLGLSTAKAQTVFPSFADLAEKLMPSVVNISTTHHENASETETNEIDNNLQTSDNIFNYSDENKISLGSGFIIDEKGYIITNNHVIDKADSITVTLSDNTSYQAKIIGTDSKTDIALIKIDTTQKLTPVIFGNSDKIRVGDWILAIGNPFGLGGSVTAGIVSAKSRDIESGPYDNFIQTDASINQGSSGGPMFNMSGELIGVNNALFSTNGASMGVGFAIPVNLINFVIEQLKNKGEVKRGWIGIKMQATTPEMLHSLGLKNQNGIIISEVIAKSTAAKAGLLAGDIILKFNNMDIDNSKNFSRIVAETKIGNNINLQIWRNKQTLNFNVKVTEMPEQTKEKSQLSPQIKTDISSEDKAPELGFLFDEIGLRLAEISPSTAETYQFLPSEKGLVILNIEEDSDALKKGLKKGTLILSVDKKPIVDFNDVNNAITESKLDNHRPILLQIKDGQQIFYVAVKLNMENKNHDTN